MVNNEITFFAETNFRNERKRFGVKTDDRRRHMYVIGQTGTGKSTMLENMIVSDILAGNGVGVVDPHGELAEKILNFVPKERIEDVIYFNPADLDHPIAFNAIEKVDLEHRHLVASGLMGVFKKIWPDVWSARMEYILNNVILALLEYPGSTLLGIQRMLGDKVFRKQVVENVTDPVIKAFWTQEFVRYNDRFEVEAIAPIQNKVGQFTSAAVIRNILGQQVSSFDMRKAMDEGKIIIFNLSKGRIGEDNSKLLGGMLITKLQLAAMSRVDVPELERKDFYLYVDEFQNFATESFANILSEARKYRLELVLAHQYIEQLAEEVRAAVFGNVGTLISFRIGAQDAEFMEQQFGPDFTATDLVNLSNYNIYLRLMIDGVASRPFSAITLPPYSKPEQSFVNEIIDYSRKAYSTPRAVVEEAITRASGLLPQTPQSTQFQAEINPATKGLPAALQTTMYEAECANCEKTVHVPFKPDGVRPVYCKECFGKAKQAPKNQKRYPEQTSKSQTSFGKGLQTASQPKKRKEVDTLELRSLLEQTLKENSKQDEPVSGQSKS